MLRLLTLFLSATLMTAAEIPDVIRLWPTAAPGSEKVSLHEKITERSTDPRRPSRIYTQITEPSLTVHRPANPNGTAVIIAPGGAYTRIVIDKEGPDTSAWLNRIGVTAFVLKYRLPGEGHEHGEDVALQDAQRAVRFVRAHAADWGLDSKHIGFLGYSAGGHLATSLALYFDTPTYRRVDVTDDVSARPDFAVLGYPWYPGGKGIGADDSPALERLMRKYPIKVRANVTYPPCFIFHADDDPTAPPQASAEIYAALHSAKAPAELHVFKSGGHGFGIRDATGPCARWPDLCADWMRGIGVEVAR